MNGDPIGRRGRHLRRDAFRLRAQARALSLREVSWRAMVVQYEMTPKGTVSAYWYRWSTSLQFKLGVLAFGLVPALLAFALAASAVPRRLAFAVIVAAVVELFSPKILAFLIQQLSRRGSRTLMIDADGLTTEVATGQWQASWGEISDIAVTSEFVFLLGRGINSISIPASAFSDGAERDEFLRRAHHYHASAQPR